MVNEPSVFEPLKFYCNRKYDNVISCHYKTFVAQMISGNPAEIISEMTGDIHTLAVITTLDRSADGTE